ncbi:MAG TPA: zinc ribbon domain-containing protein [Oscillospiraceae bacterium]|nr:zinc ribbon domain-containing protein [Oscillospiraceae bacterium]HNW04641.1 zinc ribbon domain-containing protein [Oscillospiraceae bacterium]HPV99658.1 zinc ribbon domain-containing protein [Oscillospiraceae bacterium]
MANFDSIVGDFRIIAEEMEKKTREAIELSRLRMEKIQVKSDMRKNYENIGELVYAEHRLHENNADVIDIFNKEIDREYEHLNEIAARIRKLRNRAQCPACGAQNEADAAYCSHCGAEMKSAEEPVTAAIDKTAEDLKEVARGVKETLSEKLETAGQYVEKEKAKFEEGAAKLSEKAAKLAECAERSAKAEAEEAAAEPAAAQPAPETDAPAEAPALKKGPAPKKKK